jgi:hypothetical protein
MGQSKAKGTASGSSKVMSPLSPMGMLFGGGIGRALGGGGVAKASVSPSTSSSAPSSASGTSSPFSKQESFGINSITSPFGGLRAVKKRAPWEGDLDLPGTSVGLTPGSEDKEEEDTITAPRINDEEKRREATDKASTWLN